MLECPNEACPHAARTSTPAEFRAGTSHCSDCGTALVPARARPRPERTHGAPWGALFTTVVLLVGYTALRAYPFLEAPTYLPLAELQSLSPLSLGIEPVILGFAATTLVRSAFPGGFAWRGGVLLGGVASLGFAWLLAGSRLAIVIASQDHERGTLMAMLVGGTVVSAAVAVAIDRLGVVSGAMALYVVGDLPREAARFVMTKLAPRAVLDEMALRLAVVALIVFLTLLVAGVPARRLGAGWSIAPTEDEEESPVAESNDDATSRAPRTADMVALGAAAGIAPLFVQRLFNALMSLTPLSLRMAVDVSALEGIALHVALSIGVGWWLLAGPWIARTVAVVTRTSEAERADEVRARRRTAVLRGAAYILAIEGLGYGCSSVSGGYWPRLSMIAVGTVVVLDGIATFRARAAADLTVLGGQLSLPEAIAVATALGGRRERVLFRNEHTRCLLPIVGPLVPVTLAVPERARKATARVLGRLTKRPSSASLEGGA
jgi:hypothetical protein